MKDNGGAGELREYVALVQFPVLLSDSSQLWVTSAPEETKPYFDLQTQVPSCAHICTQIELIRILHSIYNIYNKNNYGKGERGEAAFGVECVEQNSQLRETFFQGCVGF